MFEVVEAKVEDMGVIASLWAAGYPLKPTSATEFGRQFRLEPHLRSRHWIGLIDGKPIGMATLEPNIGSYHPEKWVQFTAVLPDYRNQGFGDKLWIRSREAIAGEPLSILTMFIEEDDEPSLRFAAKRGFKEVKRDFESELFLPNWTPIAAEVPEGYTIEPFDAVDSPEFRREFHRVFEVVRVDVPRTDPPTPLDYDFFESETIEQGEFMREGSHFAFFIGELVGFATVFNGAVGGRLDQGLTAVLREHRGNGIARALKVAVMHWAKAAGFQVIRTDNDTRNAPMLAINESLGYRRLKGTVTLMWTPSEISVSSADREAEDILTT